MVGFIINCPEILPIRITPMGPPQGISDNIRAADVALAAITSGSCFPSEESTFAITYETGDISGYIIRVKKSQMRNLVKYSTNEKNNNIPEPHGRIQEGIVVV
jgi:hypothetical protein